MSKESTGMTIRTLIYPQSADGQRDYESTITLTLDTENLGYTASEWKAETEENKLEVLREAIVGILHCEIEAEEDE